MEGKGADQWILKREEGEGVLLSHTKGLRTQHLLHGLATLFLLTELLLQCHDTLQISSSGASRSYSSLRNQPFWPRILSSSVQALGTAEYLAELPSCSDAEPLIRFAFPLLGCSTSEAVLLGCACVRVVVVGFGFSAIVVHLALNLSTLLQVLEREWWLGRKSTT